MGTVTTALAVEDLIAAILPKLERIHGNGKNVSARCPFPDHEDRNASFSISRVSGLWKCHGACGRTGNVFQLATELGALPPSSRPARTPSVEWGLGSAMAKYGVAVTAKAVVFPIRDHEGNRCRDHARLHSGEPRFQYWGKERTYHAYIPDWQMVREWGAYSGSAYVVEGNRDALTLAAHGWPSIGILGVDHFERAMEDIAGPLKSLSIGALVLTPDNDDEGMSAVQKWVPKLEALGFVVGVRVLPSDIADAPVKDMYDAFAADRDGFDGLMHLLPVTWRGA